VTTALSDELDRTPAPLAKLTRIQNQTYLSIATGSFVAADAALDAWDEVIASSRDEDDHFEPTIVHIELALEEGRKNKARALAEAYLAHRPAWAMSDSNDGSMFSLATLHRVGAITDGDFAARRQAWLDKKKTQPRGGDYGAAPAFTWIAAFAASATSPDEAREALDVLPDYLPLPDPMMRAPEFEEPIGNAYRLAGRNAEAIPFLTLAAKSCVGLGSSFAPIWARLELGEALESTGDQAGACDAYRVVVKRWGATPTSMSARHAAALLRALACPK
jgi:hypothetical protein